MRCNAKEKGKHPCVLLLDPEGYCDRHCRAKVRTCNQCSRRYEKGEAGLEACPDCGCPRWCVKAHKKGGRRCGTHGGNSLKGLLHPKVQGGSGGEQSRYLGVLGPRMRARVEAGAGRANKLSLADEIDLAGARLEELVERAESVKVSAETWREAQAAFEAFADANEKRDRPRALGELAKLGTLLRHGVTDYDAWDDVRKERAALVRMVESERRREIERVEVVQAVVVLRLIDAMVASVKQRLSVLDEGLKNDILDGTVTDILRLAGAVFGRQAPAGAAGAEAGEPVP